MDTTQHQYRHLSKMFLIIIVSYLSRDQNIQLFLRWVLISKLDFFHYDLLYRFVAYRVKYWPKKLHACHHFTSSQRLTRMFDIDKQNWNVSSFHEHTMTKAVQYRQTKLVLVIFHEHTMTNKDVQYRQTKLELAI